MKYFHYFLKNEEIIASEKEIKTIPLNFIEYESTLLGEKVYYKLVNGKITEMISEAIHEQAARRRVEEFISGFIATPFEAL